MTQSTERDPEFIGDFQQGTRFLIGSYTESALDPGTAGPGFIQKGGSPTLGCLPRYRLVTYWHGLLPRHRYAAMPYAHNT